MKHPPTTSHNYEPKVLAATLAHGLRPGKTLTAEVRHDSWCDSSQRRGGGFCNCDPEVYILETIAKEQPFQ